MSVLTMKKMLCTFDYQSVSETKLLPTLMGFIEQSHSWIYAVFVNEVVLGVVRNGQLLLGHTRPVREQVLDEDQVKHLQEIRIFDPKQEVRAIRTENGFGIRVLKDELQSSAPGQQQLGCLQETQKLWGKSKVKETNDSNWTLLSSERGTQLYFPESLKHGAEKGLIVRNYIDFEDPKAIGIDDVWKPRSGYRFVDERMVDFQDWFSKGDK